MKEFSQFKNNTAKVSYENYLNECEQRWPIESNNQYIETSFGSTYVRVCGDGEPLVLLPGTMASSLQYDRVIEKLSKEFKVYVIDIIGDFGRSYLSKKITSSNDYVIWQSELYSKLGLNDGFSLLGVSMGAWLGALYATQHIELKKLIMVSPVSVVAPINLKTTFAGIMPMIFPFTGRFFMKWYFKDFYKSVAEADEIFETEILKPINISKKCFRPCPPQIPTQFEKEQIDAIKSDVFYMVGENEIIYSAKKGIEFFNQNFKSGISECIPDVGHDLMAIKPEYISDKVIKYLKYNEE